jgi:hypothetical protein
MPTDFIEIVVRPRRRRRSRRRLSISTRTGLRCSFTAGVPAELAGRLLSTALSWRRRSC